MVPPYDAFAFHPTNIMADQILLAKEVITINKARIIILMTAIALALTLSTPALADDYGTEGYDIDQGYSHLVEEYAYVIDVYSESGQMNPTVIISIASD